VQTEQEKIYHHHTPRFYLLPWADADERIMWLGYGKILRSGLTVVGGENNFYRLPDLTERDIFLLREFIKLLPEAGRKNHEDLVTYFALPPALKRNLEVTGNGDPEAMRLVNVAIANLNENYHTAIENDFRPYLDSMLAGDASFYEDDQSAMTFLHALSVQNLRTKAVKDRMIERVKTGPWEMNERVWPIMSHMAAAAIGGSFFVERKKFKIVLLDNHTDVPFITSDQPIINLLSNPTDRQGPERAEFYYPLSPTKAMLYLEKANPAHSVSRALSIDEAHSYNILIAEHSGRRIFSNSEEYLGIIHRHMQGCANNKRTPASSNG
jgi:hypothetical protein